MAKCVLHVGMPKSGSTSIQYSLRDLDDDKFYYARILNRPSHTIPVTAMFTPADDKRLDSGRYARGGMDIRETVQTVLADLENSIRTAGGRTIILSGEGMLHMHREDLARLKTFFSERGYEQVGIIAYIRPPLGYVSSAVQQKLKSSPKMGFEIDRLLPNYKKRFVRFDDVFGSDNVRLVKFDPKRFPDRDVVSDICMQLGIPLASVVPVMKNEGITRLAAQMRYRLAILGESRGLTPLNRRSGVSLCQRLRPLDETRFRLAPSFTRQYINKVEDDVAWMEQRLGQSLKEELIDEPSDVYGPDDLLRPVPGIAEKLRAVLTEDGIAIPPGQVADELQLLTLIGNTSGMRTAQSEMDEDEDADHERRATHQQSRARKELANADSESETARRIRQVAKRGEGKAENEQRGRLKLHNQVDRAARRVRRDKRRKDAAVQAPG